MIEVSLSWELIISGIVSLLVALIAHRASVVISARNNKAQFKLKTFESLDLENKELRKENDELKLTNLELRAANYRMETDINNLKSDKERIEGDLRRITSDLERSLEREFQLKAEVEALKKSNDSLSDRVSALEKSIN